MMDLETLTVEARRANADAAYVLRFAPLEARIKPESECLAVGKKAEFRKTH
jgi:hypothetical protein